PSQCGPSHPPALGRSDDAVDRRFDLRPREADVAQDAVVELAQPCDGGATHEITRHRVPAGAQAPRECAGPRGGARPSDCRKHCRHVRPPGCSGQCDAVRAQLSPGGPSVRWPRGLSLFRAPTRLMRNMIRCMSRCNRNIALGAIMSKSEYLKLADTIA